MEPGVEPTCPKLLLGKYQLGRLLGRGAYAKVYHARSLEDDMGVAIKVIDRSKVAGTTMEPRILREVSVMRRLSHPNIVKLHEVMATKSKIYMVMEHAKGGELFTQISRDGPLTEPVARRYFQQLVSAVHYCHSKGVTHRDIKPQNILLDHEGNLKVSDFGLSALPELLRDGLLHTSCGTPAFTAPEVVRRKGYDGAKADAWSCGIILYLLLAGYLPFNEANIAVMYQKMYLRDFEFPCWISKSAQRVISRLLDPNPQNRITIEELIRISWFKRSLQSNQASFDLSPHEDLLNTCKAPEEVKFDPIETAQTMNAFDIISLSSGLDLSGLFEGAVKRAKRFTSMESTEKILKRLEDLGAALGYKVDRKKGVVLVKQQLILSVSILEVALPLLLVEVKVIGDNGAEFEELFQGELKSQLEDLVFEWQKDYF
ncbi:CBL-interacting protein kinase 4-like protein [Cinnamomum micranthum f. kanehirae]|uniref:non-specific serine/threonine protein kinase n=1 Tax=Cinnamomum micranthum f. kanehirae TaxID=337451 RepID=A0A443NR18_9MAGN|nr:CBL-interacting protein kinase 4-like protein [Cinnamomum micranthum f. kanehirae]